MFRKNLPIQKWGIIIFLVFRVITSKPIRFQILDKIINRFCTKCLLYCKKGTLSPFNDHLHRREETGGWGHLRSAVSVISVGNGADAGFRGVLFSSVPRSRVSVHTDNSIYSDVP